MAKTLEEYTNEIANSYSGSQGALQNQLDAIEGNLNTSKDKINRDYAFQQAQLYNAANSAARSASLSAAARGSGFGGQAEIAKKKYYEQTFVPAQMQLSNNRQDSLDTAQTDANNRRTTLEGQLASLQDTIAQSAQQRYYDALEADRQYELQQQQLALQKAAQANENAYYKYLMQSAQANNADNNKTYIGNDDYRGWLNYLAKNGNTTAAGLLNYAGNDGGVSNRNASGSWLNDTANKLNWANAGKANDYYYNQWLQGRS